MFLQRHILSRDALHRNALHSRPTAILSVCTCVHVFVHLIYAEKHRADFWNGGEATLYLLYVKSSVRVSSPVNYPKLWTAAFGFVVASQL